MSVCLKISDSSNALEMVRFIRKPVDFGSFTIETTRVQHAEVDSVYSRHLGDPAVQWCITASMIGVYQSLR